MNWLAYFRGNLTGAWQVLLGRPEGLNRLDTSLEGFWRSFAVVVLVVPFALLALLSQEPSLSESGTPLPLTRSAFALYGVALLVDWFTFPLVFALLAKPLGLGSRYVPFIVARNWAAVIISAMLAVVHASHLFGVLPSVAMPFVVIIATAVALRFAYVIARTALVVSMAIALAIVVVDFLISLVIWSVFERLVRIYCLA
jgi:hypothetical protein